MGFFDSRPRFDYRQIGGDSTNQMVQGLENFNPYQFLMKADPVERGYKQASKQFFGGKTPYDQIAGLAPTLGAIGDSYAQGNRLTENALTSGAGGLGDQDLARAQAATLQSRNAQNESTDKANAVSGYRQEATQGYEGARNNRFQQALGAGALGLQGKQSALQGYLQSFKPPTSYGQSPFDIAKGIAGTAAAFV